VTTEHMAKFGDNQPSEFRDYAAKKESLKRNYRSGPCQLHPCRAA